MTFTGIPRIEEDLTPVPEATVTLVFNNRNVYVSPKSKIGQNVRIGDNVAIYDNVEIPDNSSSAMIASLGSH